MKIISVHVLPEILCYSNNICVLFSLLVEENRIEEYELFIPIL